MKKISILGLFIFALLSFNSCETEDDVVFTTQDPEGFVFTNSTQDNYILSTATSGNLGERFTWGSADFGAPTNITYELQRSVSGDFTDAVVVSSSIGNEIAMTIGQMMTVATEAGLDNDPDTPAPNVGSFSVRLRAYPGDTGSGTEAFSDVLVLNVELLESTGAGPGGAMIAEVGVVGSGYNNWGAYADGYFYTTDTPDVFVSYVTLVDGEIKFRLNNDWGTNWGGSGGTLVQDGDNIAVTAGDYKITVDLANMTYDIEEYSWGVVGSAWNDWGGAGPDGKFYYDYTTDTFKKGIRLMAGEMKIRFNNDWAINYGDTGADGTIDQDGDNIAVAAGHYLITLDLNAGTVTIDDAASVFGVVGSGFNDWGGAGDDFALTEIQEGVFYGDIVTLLDGEIKFRANNDWGLNYGDTGADGIIDQDGDNIPSTAGPARVWLDTNTGEYSILQF
ncbi:SusE domain-containing protein [Winogradskyella aquimaris]|uniref:SusE domain-containing protein n=1 Tax=Winogradskyella aquimaris TaxID=864074 RepID=A0ABU5EMR1_9FLAO|nr:SusF/SusE family outer membrane protein [Winogradskyella aquimaris]MDY2587362.1 SusE domain-containing protein [Winogradskyella aquimaris]